jgi:hypothetical protein
MARPLWSQVVAVASGLAANVVAVWSQSGLSDSASNPVAGPLSCGFAGAPRGIRTPNRQIRSLVWGFLACPSLPVASPLVLVDSQVADPGLTFVPACHARRGGNVVAVSRPGGQTACLATSRRPGLLTSEHQIIGLVLSTLYPAVVRLSLDPLRG